MITIEEAFSNLFGKASSFLSSMGNAIIFTYNYYEASNFSRKIGGNRIRKITNLDLILDIKTTKTYDYLQANGTNSLGFMALKTPFRLTLGTHIKAPTKSIIGAFVVHSLNHQITTYNLEAMPS